MTLKRCNVPQPCNRNCQKTWLKSIMRRRWLTKLWTTPPNNWWWSPSEWKLWNDVAAASRPSLCSFVVSGTTTTTRALFCWRRRAGVAQDFPLARNEGIRINLVFVNQFGEHTKLFSLVREIERERRMQPATWKTKSRQMPCATCRCTFCFLETRNSWANVCR